MKERAMALFVQLPVPQQGFGLRTGNTPLAAAAIRLSSFCPEISRIEILDQEHATYLGDAAICNMLSERVPEILAFTVYAWNVERSAYIAGRVKDRIGCRTVFGGPELTDEKHPILEREGYDLCVVGEGETVVGEILGRRFFGQKIFAPPYEDFTRASNPYLSGILDPTIDSVIYLEGQRGCPYRCSFCFYHRSKKGVMHARQGVILDAVAYAINSGVQEVCFIDPCLTARRDIRQLLDRIAAINKGGLVSLTGELRAEDVDDDLAARFAAAGFSGFEVGLQTVNPKAAAIMRRSTHLPSFVSGIHALRKYGITPRIDLIVGLPGDDPEGFMESVDFLAESGLTDDIQVFVLSVLPGTRFRKQSKQLGLIYETTPPYFIKSTPNFSEHDIYEAICYAEQRLDISINPPWPLDLSFVFSTENKKRIIHDFPVVVGGMNYIYKIVFMNSRNPEEYVDIVNMLTHPYQILVVEKDFDPAGLKNLLSMATQCNPFTPFEVVFYGPRNIPDTNSLLDSIKLKRPSYLDLDDRYRYSMPGNRAVMFTLVSSDLEIVFDGPMQRQIYWWREKAMPGFSHIESLCHLDGILIDTPVDPEIICAWQDEHLDADELVAFTFVDPVCQVRWIEKTDPESYSPKLSMMFGKIKHERTTGKQA